MNKILSTVFICLLLIFGASDAKQVIRLPSAEAGNLINRVGTDGVDCPYQICEGYEAIGYDNPGWVENHSVVDPDYVLPPAPLVGNRSLYLADIDTIAPNATVHIDVPGSQNKYFYAILNFEALSGGPTWLKFQGAGGTPTLMEVRLSINVFQIRCPTAGQQANGTQAVNTTDNYHIWAEFEGGTGANDSVCRLFVALNTDTKPPTPDIEITSGTGTADVVRVSQESGGLNRIDAVWDKTRIDSNVIGSTPQ